MGQGHVANRAFIFDKGLILAVFANLAAHRSHLVGVFIAVRHHGAALIGIEGIVNPLSIVEISVTGSAYRRSCYKSGSVPRQFWWLKGSVEPQYLWFSFSCGNRSCWSGINLLIPTR